MIKTVDDFSLFGGGKAFSTFRTTMNLVKPDYDEFCKWAKNSFEKRQITNNGPAVQALEHRLARLHGVEHCVTFCSCFVGMYLAVQSLAISGKTEVITPSLTYRRMADIIDWAGLKPRFCDVNPDTLGVSPATIEPCINENTALILAPHPITRLCDIDGIEALAREKALPLMFDSVEACGGSHKGKMIGGFGLCESFSMHPSKVLNACEGGYITTDNKAVAEKLKKMRTYGFSGRDHIEFLGTNAKLNELHAAMGLASYAIFDQLIQENKALHLAYQKNLSHIPGLNVISYSHEEKRNWKSLLVRLDEDWPLSREETLAVLNAENINARPYYWPAQHHSFSRQAGKGEIPLPVTEKNMLNHFILPFGSTVTEADTVVIGEVFEAILRLHAEIRIKLKD